MIAATRTVPGSWGQNGNTEEQERDKRDRRSDHTDEKERRVGRDEERSTSNGNPDRSATATPHIPPKSEILPPDMINSFTTVRLTGLCNDRTDSYSLYHLVTEFCATPPAAIKISRTPQASFTTGKKVTCAFVAYTDEHSAYQLSRRLSGRLVWGENVKCHIADKFEAGPRTGWGRRHLVDE